MMRGLWRKGGGDNYNARDIYMLSRVGDVEAMSRKYNWLLWQFIGGGLQVCGSISG